MIKMSRLASAAASMMIIASLLATPVSAATASKDNYFEGLDPTQNVSSLNIENYYADYDSITFRSKTGAATELYVSGNSIGVNTSVGTAMTINVTNERNNIVATSGGGRSGSFSFDTGDNLEVNELYYIMFVVTQDGIQCRYDDIAVTKKADGNLTFVKSMCYDFNVDRCSELWTDAQSLQECLEPQNDVECDSPVVIQTAQRITQGCSNDWEKVYAIYSYMVDEFSYDYVQIEDTYTTYQDDASTLIMRKIAICEGLGNTFTALCRAVDVPAAVSFGIGADVSDLMLSNAYNGDEGCNHAWAICCIDGTWYHMDPTWDCGNAYEGNAWDDGSVTSGSSSYNWYLLPLEYFSMTHKICDADTYHGRPESGEAGDAHYEITRDGTITISGSGTLQLPYGCNGFRTVVFTDDCTIDTIADSCFADCDIITSVVLPDTVTTIEDYAFNTCEDLEYIYLPDGLQNIGVSAFDYCDELAYVYVPDSIARVDTWAFDDCPRAIISIPSGCDLEEEDYYIPPYRIIERGR
jgi:hypothetical protein